MNGNPTGNTRRVFTSNYWGNGNVYREEFSDGTIEYTTEDGKETIVCFFDGTIVDRRFNEEATDE